MKIKLTIDGQPLVLSAKQAGALFGLERLREIVEGRWTPFVFCDRFKEKEPDEVEMTTINVTGMSGAEVIDLIKDLAPETFTFADDVMAVAQDSD